jgi:hypothetical protein
MRAVSLVLAMIVLSANAASAADRNGEFYSRGVGARTCQQYLADATGQTEIFPFYRSWLNGYMTAYNAQAADTYDIAPNATVEGLAETMARICQENPDRPFWAAAVALTRALHPNRVTVKPQLVAMTAGSQSMSIEREVLRQVQAALKARGYSVGVVDGLYGQNTRRALESFQGDSQLPVTGLPDPETRAKLLP